MKSINLITKENFNTSFNIRDILQDSVYYPASGIDATPIEVFSDKYKSFVNVDYSRSYEDVRRSLESDFVPVGYKLIGVKNISREELIPSENSTIKYEFNEHEKDRLVDHSFIKELFENATSSFFAIWAIYELDSVLTGKTDGKADRFSLLHVRGEGWAVFEGLYVENKVNPKAIAIIRPGEGFGDNWTLFTDAKFRFYESVRKNKQTNGAEMPRYILTDAVSDAGVFWNEYAFTEKFPLLECSLYELKK